MGIYQKFDLDLDTLGGVSTEECSELDLHQAKLKLIQRLQDQGYEVFESSDSYSGLPGSILVSKRNYSNPKEVFFELTKDLGLKYKSSVFYTRR